MEILSTVLTILNIVDKSRGIHDWFTAVSKGDKLKQALSALEKSNAEVKRLSDRVLWAPAYLQAGPFEATPILLPPTDSDLVGRLDAGQGSTGGDVLISAVAQTPARLRSAFDRNPFEVLIDARPEHRAIRPMDPDLVPIRFVDGTQAYIGWQKRGALPQLFDCDFQEAPQTVSPAHRSRPVKPTEASQRLVDAEESFCPITIYSATFRDTLFSRIRQSLSVVHRKGMLCLSRDKLEVATLAWGLRSVQEVLYSVSGTEIWLRFEPIRVGNILVGFQPKAESVEAYGYPDCAVAIAQDREDYGCDPLEALTRWYSTWARWSPESTDGVDVA